MFQSLLVPLDRSPESKAALPLARLIAERAKARLDLVAVHTLYCAHDATAGWVAYEPERDADWKRQARSHIAETAGGLQGVSAITIA